MNNNIICPCGEEINIKQKYGITTYMHTNNKSCKYLNRFTKQSILAKRLSDIAIKNNDMRQMFALKDNSNEVINYLVLKLSTKDYNELENNFKLYQKIIEPLKRELYKKFGAVFYKNLRHLNMKYSTEYIPGIVATEFMLDLTQKELKSNVRKLAIQLDKNKIYKKFFKKRDDNNGNT